MEKLTKKQRGFVKDYVKTENGTQSAMKHYNVKNETVASSIATENLRKPLIQEAIKSIADRIPNELLEKVHLEGLEAEKKVFKNNNATGEIEEVSSEPDHAVRHKYLDSAYKLKGVYAPEKAVNLNIEAEITNPAATQLAKEYEEKLKQNL